MTANDNDIYKISKSEIRLAGFPASAKTEEARYVFFRVRHQGSDKPEKLIQPNKSGSKKWKNCPAGDLYSFSELEPKLGSDPDLVPALVLETAGLTCIDIDRAYDDQNQVLSEIQTLIDSTSGYLEASVSGKGFHLLFESGDKDQRCQRVKHPVANADLIEPADGLLLLTGDVIDNRSKVGSVSDFRLATARIESIFSPAKPAQRSSGTEEWLRKALDSISSQYFETYEQWLHIGMAVHSVMPCQAGLDLWDEFSESKAPYEYEDGICEAKWDSFSGDRETSITWQTLAKLADRSGRPISELMLDPASPESQQSFDVLDRLKSLPNVPEAELPVTNWLVEGFLPRPSVSAIVAPAKAGKSLIVNQLQAAILRGETFLGMKTQQDLDEVTLHIDLEMTQAEARSRQVDLLSYMAEEQDISTAETQEISQRMLTLSLAGSDYEFNAGVSLSHCLDQVSRHLESQGKRLSLVVLDSLYMGIGDADESDPRAMKTVLSSFKNLAARYNVALVLVHHSTKGLSDHKAALDVASGSSVLARIVDSQLTMRQHAASDENFSVHVTARGAEARSMVVERRYPVFTERADLDPGRMKSSRDYQSGVAKASSAETHSRLRAGLAGKEDITLAEIKTITTCQERHASSFRDLGLIEGWLIETEEHRNRSKIYKIQDQPNCN